MSIKFKNHELFGRLFDSFINDSLSFVSHMYIDGKIDKNGLIKNANLTECWSYVYYLYYFNKTQEVFIKMKTLRGNHASAKNFYKTVHEYTNTSGVITVPILEQFINKIVTKYTLNNPIIKNKTSPNKHSKTLVIDNAPTPASVHTYVNSSKSKEDLDKLRNYIKTLLKTSTNDVDKLLEIMKKELNKTSNINIKSIKKDCKQDILEFKEEIKNNIEMVILGKMCFIKYLGIIVNADSNNSSNSNSNSKCKSIDLSQQISLFSNLPESKQDEYKALYKKYKNDILQYRDIYMNMNISCNNYSKYREQYDQDIIILNNIFAELSNLSEDLYGSVRCYIKLRKFIPKIDNETSYKNIKCTIKDNTNITLECNNMQIKANFFGVFGPEYKNADIYSGIINTKTDGLKIKISDKDIKPWSFSKTFKQLQSGYSISLLTTGYSGSGKSYTFFGNEDEPGIINYGLANLDNISKINIEYVFELYYDYININDRKMSGKVIISYDHNSDLRDKLAKYDITNIDYDIISLKSDILSNSDINDNMKIIMDNQQQKGRIKKTLNNDKSSRSHLFVILKVGKSYLTIVDMAGTENAFNIYENLFKTKMSLPYFLMQFDNECRFKAILKNEKIEKYISGFNIKNGDTELKKNDIGELKFAKNSTIAIEDTLQKNVQILLESFYITETLNHMKCFFNTRNNIEQRFEYQSMVAGTIQYRTNRVFVDPVNELFASGHKHINMIPILNFISDLGAGNTVSKFILCGAIRPDKCEDNIQTINYLNSISSTKAFKE